MPRTTAAPNDLARLCCRLEPPRTLEPSPMPLRKKRLRPVSAQITGRTLVSFSRSRTGARLGLAN